MKAMLGDKGDGVLPSKREKSVFFMRRQNLKSNRSELPLDWE